MQVLKYTVIKNALQYEEYCNLLESLAETGEKDSEEAALLTVLIEKWDAEHNTFRDVDPVELLRGLMNEHSLNATKLAASLQVSKGLVSDILHYKKGLSKDNIRILAALFKVSQEAFNRPYALVNPASHRTFQKISDVHGTPVRPRGRVGSGKTLHEMSSTAKASVSKRHPVSKKH